MHPHLVELAAAERRQELIRAADRNRRLAEARGRHDRSWRTENRPRRPPSWWLPRYASFGFLARLGATRGGSPGIFG